MSARREITKKYASEYAKASQGAKGVMLGQLVGRSGTRPGPLLRNSIQVHKTSDEHEQAPGFVEADLVLHCGATLWGEFVHTLTVTDVFTGWTARKRGSTTNYGPHYRRVIDAGILTDNKTAELAALFEATNPKPSPQAFREQNQMRHAINFRVRRYAEFHTVEALIEEGGNRNDVLGWE